MWAYHIEAIYTTIPYGAHAELRRIMTPMNCKVRYFSVGRIGNRTVLLTIMKSDSVSPCIAPYRSPYPFPFFRVRGLCVLPNRFFDQSPKLEMVPSTHPTV